MRWGVLVVASLALLACSKKTTGPGSESGELPMRVARIQVKDLTPAELRPQTFAADRLEKILSEALIGADLKVGPPKDDEWKITVEAQVIYGISKGDGLADRAMTGPAKAAWEAVFKFQPPGALDSMSVLVEGTDTLAFDGKAAKLEAHLAARLKASAKVLAQSVVGRARVLAQPPETLVNLLEDPKPGVRLAAASRLAMLRLSAAVPTIAKRLPKETDRTVKLRLIGALAEIGDDRAAPALISAADPKDRELLRAVLGTLSVIGGERGGDFFEILSTHDDADIRLMVEQAQERMTRLHPKKVEP